MENQKKCIIFETLNNVDGLKKTTGTDGLMRMSGIFGVTGVLNNNKRVYEKKNYGEKVNLLKQLIKSDGVPGELEHPASNTLNITLENISHKIESIDMKEDGTITGTICLLNTPKGKIAQAIVEGGLPLFISSRATGNVDKNGVVTLENLKTYDLVGSPGFSQARLSLNENQTFESITESLCMIVEGEEEGEEKSKNKIKEDMELQEQIDNLKLMIVKLQEANSEFVTKSWVLESYTPMVEKWMVEEFAPEVQTWLEEEFMPEHKEDVIDEAVESISLQAKPMMENFVIENLAPSIQSWIVEEYTPEVHKYLYETLAPAIQDWIIEEYSPEVQKWVVEEYSPTVQNWVVEEYSNTISEWVENEVKPEIVAESLLNNKPSLQSIDEMLSVIEQKSTQKPTYSRKSINEGNKDINESLSFVRDMPAQYRPLWNLASQSVKESILSRAKLFNFVNESSVDKFWSSVDFVSSLPTIAADAPIEDVRTKAIRESLRRSAVGRSLNS